MNFIECIENHKRLRNKMGMIQAKFLIELVKKIGNNGVLKLKKSDLNIKGFFPDIEEIDKSVPTGYLAFTEDKNHIMYNLCDSDAHADKIIEENNKQIEEWKKEDEKKLMKKIFKQPKKIAKKRGRPKLVKRGRPKKK